MIGGAAKEVELTQLKSRIRTAGLELTAMQARVQELEDALKTPYINILVDEVLSTIFDMVVASSRLHPDSWRYSQKRNAERRPELTLSHVCRRWREIATDNSSLWAQIIIFPAQSEDLHNLYLERSRDRSLNVHVSFKDTAYTLRLDRLQRTLEQTIALAGPCSGLEIAPNNYCEHWSSLYPALTQTEAPHLKELILGRGLTNSSIGDTPLFNGRLPVLNVLQAHDVPPTLLRPLLDAPQLTSLTLRWNFTKQSYTLNSDPSGFSYNEYRRAL
ncbi:hypothetical protein HYDPIDRAFT_28202 [Hydnomerulius pinastri MD-312]|uniref:F-box domain-containing protein n=1 Tax=Hydnomerulius pinastri MD-312 TaxID=994086 RepID=A0A0C9WG57_9AGAM|nr:hypothetical protein HYDPIDRAFT_28202 [Hydnomerulius pinastri MD-312]